MFSTLTQTFGNPLERGQGNISPETSRSVSPAMTFSSANSHTPNAADTLVFNSPSLTAAGNSLASVSMLRTGSAPGRSASTASQRMALSGRAAEGLDEVDRSPKSRSRNPQSPKLPRRGHMQRRGSLPLEMLSYEDLQRQGSEEDSTITGVAAASDEAQESALGLSGLPSSQDPLDLAQEDEARPSGPDINRTPSCSASSTTESSNADSHTTNEGSVVTSVSSNSRSVTTPDVKDESPAPAKVTETELAAPIDEAKLMADSRAKSQATRLCHGLLELVDTERSYAADLEVLVTIYLDNLNAQPFFEESPRRVDAVKRNAEDLLRFHLRLSRRMESILEDEGLRAAPAGQDWTEEQLSAGYRCVVRVSRHLVRVGPRLSALYQEFCSKHAEAQVLIREAERKHSGEDWAAFERTCGNVLRGSRTPLAVSRAASIRGSISGASTPAPASGSAPQTPHLGAAPLTPLTPAESFFPSLGAGVSSGAPSAAPSLGSLTPGGSTNGGPSQAKPPARLQFSDYLIKPIQRLCLYPVVFNTLAKNAAADVNALEETQLAIACLRRVAEEVDDAGREREKVLMAEVISSRVEPTLSVTPATVAAMGNCVLAGTLDVLHHHEVLEPLTAPLRLRYLAAFLYPGWLLLAKVKKPHAYEPRHWFPLWACQLSTTTHGSSLEAMGDDSSPAPLPHSFQIVTSGGHYFDFSTSSDAERQLWVQHLSTQIGDATFAPPRGSALSAYPSSLGDFSADSDDLRVSGIGALSNREGSIDLSMDPLSTFLARQNAGTSEQPVVIRSASASQRAATDRSMIFSEACFAVRGGDKLREGDAANLIWHPVNPSIGATVKSYAKAAATSTRKKTRRATAPPLSLLDMSLAPPEGLAPISTSHAAALSDDQPSSPSSPGTWRSSMLIRNLRSLSSNGGMFTVGSGTNTVDRRSSLASLGPASAASSAPSSPRTATRALSVDASERTINANSTRIAPVSDSSPRSSAYYERPKQSRSSSNLLRDVWASATASAGATMRRSRTRSENAAVVSLTPATPVVPPMPDFSLAAREAMSRTDDEPSSPKTLHPVQTQGRPRGGSASAAALREIFAYPGVSPTVAAPGAEDEVTGSSASGSGSDAVSPGVSHLPSPYDSHDSSRLNSHDSLRPHRHLIEAERSQSGSGGSVMSGTSVSTGGTRSLLRAPTFDSLRRSLSISGRNGGADRRSILRSSTAASLDVSRASQGLPQSGETWPASPTEMDNASSLSLSTPSLGSSKARSSSASYPQPRPRTATDAEGAVRSQRRLSIRSFKGLRNPAALGATPMGSVSEGVTPPATTKAVSSAATEKKGHGSGSRLLRRGSFADRLSRFTK